MGLSIGQVGAGIVPVLRCHLLARLAILPLAVPVVWLALGSTTAVRFAAVGLLVGAPWTMIHLRVLRDGHRATWATGVTDVVISTMVLLQLGRYGWVAAQLGVMSLLAGYGAIVSPAAAARVTVAAAVIGAVSAPIVDVPVELEIALLLALGVAGFGLARMTGAVRAELIDVANDLRETAMREPSTGLRNRTALVAWLDDRLAEGRQVVVAVHRLERIDELAAAFGRPYANERLASAGRFLAERYDGIEAQLDSTSVAKAIDRSADDTGLAKRADRRVDELFRSGELQALDAHVGWCIGPADADTGADLVALAEGAAHEAATRRARLVRAVPGRDASTRRRLTLLDALRADRAFGDLTVHFQPQIDLASGHLVGVEALARWRHPVLGDVRPDEFIHIAELAGLLPDLTLAVFDRSLEAMTRWDELRSTIAMSVNVALTDFDRLDLPAELSARWHHHGIDPARLTIEITESQASDTHGSADGPLRQLAAAGVGIAVDDFGTGHSSLLRLRDLPVTELKIDRAFISGMLVSEDDAAIVESTLQLARSLGLEVVAEGVEDEGTLQRLTVLGCDRVQGYLYSPAVPAAEIPALRRRWAQDPVRNR